MTIITKNILSKNAKQFKTYESLGYLKEDGGYSVSPEHLGEHSHMKVLVSCDSGKNPKCLGTFEREWRSVVVQHNRLGTNADYCKFCQKTEEYTGRGNPNTKYYFDDDLLKSIDTPEKAYLLGWIASDGSIGSSGAVSISVRDYDVEILLKLRKLLDINIPITEKENMVSLTLSSSTIANDCLIHLGLEKAGKKDSLVKYPIHIPKELDPYFIRGYFDGDGSVSLHSRIPRVSIASNSVNMLEGIQYRSGFGNVYLSSSGNQWQVNSGEEAINFLRYIYNDTKVPYLDRKFNKFAQVEKWVPSLAGKGSTLKFNTVDGIIKFNKTRPDAILPIITDIHASGIDLHIIEKVKDFSTEVSLYTTGIKVCPPEGYYFMLVGRSSISKSGFSLANGIGIIDENYVGEILVPLRKHSSEELSLPNRLVQLVLVPKINCEYTVVDSLDDTVRGSGGFGSTGV